jgi:alpha-L-rhamnosidase
LKKSKKIQFTITLLAGLVLSVSVQAVAAGSSKQYNITSYGAVGHGKTLNTFCIQAAIDACSKAGGGMVIVPAGKFITGAIFLKQGVNLNIEKDGVLKGSVTQADYPQINTRWEGEERIWTSAMINIIDINDGCISIISGNAGYRLKGA